MPTLTFLDQLGHGPCCSQVFSDPCPPCGEVAGRPRPRWPRGWSQPQVQTPLMPRGGHGRPHTALTLLALTGTHLRPPKCLLGCTLCPAVPPLPSASSAPGPANSLSLRPRRMPCSRDLFGLSRSSTLHGLPDPFHTIPIIWGFPSHWLPALRAQAWDTFISGPQHRPSPTKAQSSGFQDAGSLGEPLASLQTGKRPPCCGLLPKLDKRLRMTGGPAGCILLLAASEGPGAEQLWRVLP